MNKISRIVAALVVAAGIVAVGVWYAPRHDNAAPAPLEPVAYDIRQFERLSLDIRSRRITGEERETILASLAGDPSTHAAVYASYVDRWLTPQSLKRFAGVFMRFATLMVYDPDAETFFHRLEKHGSGNDGTYFLPHQAASPDRPCDPGDVETVAAWWSDEPVRICPASHRPENVFDEMGYCSGEAEPFMRQPPRAACGCGPVLMGCLPPEGEEPEIDGQVASAVMDEWLETAGRIVAAGRPLDELVTTTETWQTGLIEFLYARRDMLARISREGWSPELAREIEERFLAVDVRAPGRWIERKGIYEGSGLWWTTMLPHSIKFPVRAGAHNVLATFVCSEFHAVNVDAEAVLDAVGKQNENLRTLSSITAAPMRFQTGCKGCHAPMDGAAGFMGEMQAAMYGSHPTGMKSEGEFFVSGAEDFRGKGEGIAALSRFIVEAPEFETCSVRRALEVVLKRPMKSHDHDLFNELIGEFRSNGHHWAPVLKAVFESDSYRAGLDTIPPREGSTRGVTEMPEVVSDVIEASCAECHDAEHPTLDLRSPPELAEIEKWKSILGRVSDYSMPPPKRDAEIEARFPLDPARRKAFTGAVIDILGEHADSPEPPRRIDHRTWVQVLRQVAAGRIEEGRTEDLLDEELPSGGILAKLPPRGWPAPLALAVERASESFCTELAGAERDNDDPRFGLGDAGSRSAASTGSGVSEFLELVYGREPSQADVRSGVEFLGSYQDMTGDRVEAWIALCSTHLSGPALFFGPYAQEEPPPAVVQAPAGDPRISRLLDGGEQGTDQANQGDEVRR